MLAYRLGTMGHEGPAMATVLLLTLQTAALFLEVSFNAGRVQEVVGPERVPLLLSFRPP